MGQKRLDGSDEGRTRKERITEMLLESGPNIDFEEKVDEGLRRGIFSLDEIIQAARRSFLHEIEQVSRSLRDKDGTPRIIPVNGKPHQGVLLDVARTEDRMMNVVRRGMQTFGHHMRWRSSARDMEERGEETLPVAEFKEGWPEILRRYQLAAAEVGADSEDVGETS